MIDTNVVIDLSGLKRFSRIIDAGLRGKSGPFHDAMKQWAVMYRSAMQDRFDRFSRGGGNWAPLAPSTIRGRRHGKGGKHKRGKAALNKALASGGGQVSILRDTNTLFKALDPTHKKPGAVEDYVDYGVKVGYGGEKKHKGSDSSIAEIASYHQSGVPGRLPQRKIIVEPDDDLKKKMVEAMESAARKAIDQASRK